VAREARPLELATAALARRDLSAAELRGALERRGVEAEDAAAAVARLEAAGYVDDSRYAAARAEALAARGYGDEGILRDLRRHGVDAAAAAAAIGMLEPEPDRAARLAGRFGRSPRTARRLAAKGFAPDVIESAFGREPT